MSGIARMCSSTWLVQTTDTMHVGRRKAFDSVYAQDVWFGKSMSCVCRTTRICCPCYFRRHRKRRCVISCLGSTRSRPCLRARSPAQQKHADVKQARRGFRYTLAGTQRRTFGPLAPPSSSLALVPPVRHRDFAIGGRPWFKGCAAAGHVHVD